MTVAERGIRRFGALAGVAAAAVALGVAELVAVATGARSAPLVAVGGVVVDTVPGPVKDFAISVFGVHDKTALLVGTVVLLAAFAAVIGVLAVLNPWYGVAGIGLFGVVGMAAALTRPGAGIAAGLPSLVGAAGAGAVLWLLVNGPLRVGRAPAATTTPAAAPPPEAVEEAPTQPIRTDVAEAPTQAVGTTVEDAPTQPDGGRRRFLRAVGAAVGVAALAGAGGRFLSTRRDVAAARTAVALPVPASPAPPVPAGADLKLSWLTPYVTSNRDFYRIDTALVVPRVDPRTWQLNIHGRVRSPMTISFDELLRRPSIERYITLACVSNEVGGDLIDNARWLGVPLKDLLDEAGPLGGADQVVGRSADGWTCGTPTEVLRDGRDAMLAFGMNGEPLPVEHGFPVRMVVPGLYGYVSACKWIVELELTSFADYDAYWVPRGWAAQAPIKTQSRIDTPRTGGTVRNGTVTVAGVAWAQHRGISKVEVRVDGDPWQPAVIADTVSTDTWLQWSWQWESPVPGEHALAVRATDSDGVIQESRQQPPAPDGATGWHTIRVTVAD